MESNPKANQGAGNEFVAKKAKGKPQKKTKR